MGNLFVLAHVLSYRYEWALRTKSSSSSLLFHLNTCTLLIFFVDVVLSHNLGQFVTIFILLSTNHPSKILYCVCSTNDVLSCVCPCHASKSEGEGGGWSCSRQSVAKSKSFILFTVADLGNEGCAPPSVQFSFIFMQFSATIMPNNRLSPLWESLDPPLVYADKLYWNFIESTLKLGG